MYLYTYQNIVFLFIICVFSNNFSIYIVHSICEELKNQHTPNVK